MYVCVCVCERLNVYFKRNLALNSESYIYTQFKLLY